jgi:hypothetical protein
VLIAVLSSGQPSQAVGIAAVRAAVRAAATAITIIPDHHRGR